MGLEAPATVRQNVSRPSGRVLHVLWDGGSRTYPLPSAGSLVIGRHESCDIVIPHPSVSRQHARLDLSAVLTVTDLGSANGTSVGGRSLQNASCELPPGTGATLGAAILLVDGERGPKLVDGQNATSGLVILPGSALAKLVETLDKVAPSPLSVLIRGETGAGKELLAHRVHEQSDRANKAFVSVNCAALPAALMESELFGHEKGAFTGAEHARPGLLQAAHGGTLFLDEVGDLAIDLQAKLLRVLESGELWRVGARAAKHIDVRFVAATNQPLQEWIAAGRFRQDLFFRLAGVTLTVPPLRDRPDEIRALAEHIHRNFAAKLKRALPPFDAALWPSLQAYPFPGNVRELKNLVERASLTAKGGTIVLTDVLPHEIPAPVAAAWTKPPSHGATLQEDLADVEAKRIEVALQSANGNQTMAAEILGVSRRTLLRRLSDYKFARPRKKAP